MLTVSSYLREGYRHRTYPNLGRWIGLCLKEIRCTRQELGSVTVSELIENTSCAYLHCMCPLNAKVQSTWCISSLDSYKWGHARSTIIGSVYFGDSVAIYTETEANNQWVQLPEEGASALRVTTGIGEMSVREAAMVSTTPYLKPKPVAGNIQGDWPLKVWVILLCLFPFELPIFSFSSCKTQKLTVLPD